MGIAKNFLTKTLSTQYELLFFLLWKPVWNIDHVPHLIQNFSNYTIAGGSSSTGWVTRQYYMSSPHADPSPTSSPLTTGLTQTHECQEQKDFIFSAFSHVCLCVDKYFLFARLYPNYVECRKHSSETNKCVPYSCKSVFVVLSDQGSSSTSILHACISQPNLPNQFIIWSQCPLQEYFS